jgi:hypothetical protein
LKYGNEQLLADIFVIIQMSYVIQKKEEEHERGESMEPIPVGGALTGVLGVASVVLTDKFLGASTSFARSAGMVEKIFLPKHVAALDYFAKYTPKIDWQWMFLPCILFGSFFSAISSHSFWIQNPPDMLVSRFGPSKEKRAIIAFAGGCIALFGARLAGCCPSGHGLGGLCSFR